jgi:hypothetical protein
MCGLSMRGMRLRYVPASGGEIPFGVLGRRGEVVSGPASVTPECRYGTRVVQRLLSGSPPLAGPENPLEPAVIALAVPSCKHPLAALQPLPPSMLSHPTFLLFHPNPDINSSVRFTVGIVSVAGAF